jgi:hypothetical protein
MGVRRSAGNHDVRTDTHLLARRCSNTNDHRARHDHNPQIAAVVVRTIFKARSEPIEASVRAGPWIAPWHACLLSCTDRGPLTDSAEMICAADFDSPPVDWLRPTAIAESIRQTTSNVFVIM